MGPSVTNDTRMSDTLRFVAAADKLSVDDILVPFVLDDPKETQGNARNGNNDNEREGKAGKGMRHHRERGWGENQRKLVVMRLFFFPLDTPEIVRCKSFFMVIE